MMPLYTTKDISGSTALITGSSAGIGEACAYMFAEKNANLILVARRKEKLESVREDIIKRFPSVSVRFETCDISDLKDIDRLFERLGDERVDILVNNAGLALGADSGDRVPVEDVQTMFNTNVIGLMSLFSKIA